MKTINVKQIMNISKVALVAFVLSAFTFQMQAQTCGTTLKSKTGKVYSANPAIIKTNSSSNQVTVRMRKTAGRAETQVNFYINGAMQQEVLEYNNGSYIPSGWQTRTFDNMDGKEIKVKIVNQSVANTFSYQLEINGQRRSVASTGGAVDGNLIGQTNKTIYTNGSCTPNTRIIVRRRDGKARANIRVWEKRNNGTWRRLDQYNQTMEKNQPIKNFVVNSNRKLKVELRNVSVGNTIKYRMNALAAN